MAKKDCIIIMGSARSQGNTKQALSMIPGISGAPMVDLKELDIKPYDYEYKNQNDDFLALIHRLVEYDTWVLATPVYWYSMSSTMKTFIDRISDLLDIHKDVARKLRGKRLFVVASYNTSLPKGFEDTFEQTCGYLGIEYLGTSFIYSGTENSELLQNNIDELQKSECIFEQTD